MLLFCVIRTAVVIGPALTSSAAVVERRGAGRVIRGGTDINASSGIVLSACIGGEDLDGVVDPGDGQERLVRVAYVRLKVSFRSFRRVEGMENECRCGHLP